MTSGSSWASALASALQRLSLVAFFAVSIAAALTARVVLEGQSELSASDAAFDRGDLLPSLDHARRSATLYAPGAPHVARAYERLAAIATGAEAAGQVKVAFLAWQAVRSAALESRHVWLPEQAELDRANQNLARWKRWRAKQATLPRVRPKRGRCAAWRTTTRRPRLGSRCSGRVFLLALLGLGLCAFRGLSPGGKLQLGRGRLGLLLFAIGAACWTLAAYKA